MHKQLLLSNVLETLQLYQESHTDTEAWLNIPEERAKSAAVLLPLVTVEGQLSLLFIERATNPNDMHSGQIAFPGGKVEKNDKDFIETAIRETREEIGIDVDVSEVLGLLPMKLSRNAYQVRPVIACVSWPQDLVLQTAEVASAFTIPLRWLVDQTNLDSATVLGLPEGVTTVYKEYKGHRVWGLTAKIIEELLKILSR